MADQCRGRVHRAPFRCWRRYRCAEHDCSASTLMDHRSAVACESSTNGVNRELYTIDEVRGWCMAEVLEPGTWCRKRAQTPWRRLAMERGRADSCRQQEAVGSSTKSTVFGSRNCRQTCKLDKFRPQTYRNVQQHPRRGFGGAGHALITSTPRGQTNERSQTGV